MFAGKPFRQKQKKNNNRSAFFPSLHSNPDRDARYAERRNIDLDAMEPLVALPGKVIGNTIGVSQVISEPSSRLFHRILRPTATLTISPIAAEVVTGRRVVPGVRFLVTPGSPGRSIAARFKAA